MSINASGKSMKNRHIGRQVERLLGPGAAALLGAASAFFCFAMPAAIVSGIVATLHLPPAVAESRLALAVGIGLAVAAATWFGFDALDRSARPRPVRFGALEGEADLAPVLRRADAHPDAPPRRPIFAGVDLGTPLDLIDPLPAEWAEPRRPAEPWTAPLAEDVEDEPVDPAPPPPNRSEMALAARDHVIAVAPVAPVAVPAAQVPSPMPAQPSSPDQPAPTLAALMVRLETGLARKSLVLAGAEANVTALKREIRPIGGSLRAAVDELQDRTAARR